MNLLDPLLSALADPTRREIVEMLSDGREMTVGEVADNFNMTRQAVAKHLAVLRKADVVCCEKRGRQQVYALNPERMAALTEWVSHYNKFWDLKLNYLKKLVEEENTHGRN